MLPPQGCSPPCALYTTNHTVCQLYLSVHNGGSSWQMTLGTAKKLIRDAIVHFPPGSAPGPSGLRPRHLQDILQGDLMGVSALLQGLALFTESCETGSLPMAAANVLCCATLIPLRKAGNKVRPVAVGETLRRVLEKYLMSIPPTTDHLPRFLPTNTAWALPGPVRSLEEASKRQWKCPISLTIGDTPGGPHQCLQLCFPHHGSSRNCGPLPPPPSMGNPVPFCTLFPIFPAAYTSVGRRGPTGVPPGAVVFQLCHSRHHLPPSRQPGLECLVHGRWYARGSSTTLTRRPVHSHLQFGTPRFEG